MEKTAGVDEKVRASDERTSSHAAGAVEKARASDKRTSSHAAGAVEKTAGVDEKARPTPPIGNAMEKSGGADKGADGRGRRRARTALGSGVVPLQGARIDWASMLKRVFLGDVLSCPCGGTRRVLSDVQDPSAVAKILRHLGLPSEPPRIARARDPAEMTFGFA